MLSRNGYIVKMDINGKPCMMELPTAEDLSIMSKSEGLDNFNSNINNILIFIERKKRKKKKYLLRFTAFEHCTEIVNKS